MTGGGNHGHNESEAHSGASSHLSFCLTLQLLQQLATVKDKLVCLALQLLCQVVHFTDDLGVNLAAILYLIRLSCLTVRLLICLSDTSIAVIGGDYLHVHLFDCLTLRLL